MDIYVSRQPRVDAAIVLWQTDLEISCIIDSYKEEPVVSSAPPTTLEHLQAKCTQVLQRCCTALEYTGPYDEVAVIHHDHAKQKALTALMSSIRRYQRLVRSGKGRGSAAALRQATWLFDFFQLQQIHSEAIDSKTVEHSVVCLIAFLAQYACSLPKPSTKFRVEWTEAARAWSMQVVTLLPWRAESYSDVARFLKHVPEYELAYLCIASNATVPDLQARNRIEGLRSELSFVICHRKACQSEGQIDSHTRSAFLADLAKKLGRGKDDWAAIVSLSNIAGVFQYGHTESDLRRAFTSEPQPLGILRYDLTFSWKLLFDTVRQTLGDHDLDINVRARMLYSTLVFFLALARCGEVWRLLRYAPWEEIAHTLNELYEARSTRDIEPEQMDIEPPHQVEVPPVAIRLLEDFMIMCQIWGTFYFHELPAYPDANNGFRLCGEKRHAVRRDRSLQIDTSLDHLSPLSNIAYTAFLAETQENGPSQEASTRRFGVQRAIHGSAHTKPAVQSYNSR